MKVSELNQVGLDKIFSIFKGITKAHWRNYDVVVVKQALFEKKEFNFKPDNYVDWTSTIVAKDINGELVIEFLIKENVPAFFQKQLKEYKEKFEKEIKLIL